MLARPTHHRGNTQHFDAQRWQRCSGLPQSQPRQHVPPEEEVVCSKRNKMIH